MARPRVALHWKILIGLILGAIAGAACNAYWTADVWASLGVNDAKTYLAHAASESNAAAGAGAWAARFVAEAVQFVGDLFLRCLEAEGVEGDESDRSLFALRPEIVVVAFSLDDYDATPVLGPLGILTRDHAERVSTWSFANVSELYLVLRWLVLLAGAVTVVLAWRGWLGRRSWTGAERGAARAFVAMLDFQFAVGLALYLFYSPITRSGFAVSAKRIRVPPSTTAA